MTNEEKIKRLYEMLDETEVYGRTLGKLYFDMQCCAPVEGLEQAGADIAVLSKAQFAIEHSEEYVRLISELRVDGEGLTALEKKLVELLNESYDKTRNMSPEFAYEMQKAASLAYGSWLQAKSAKDFGIFQESFRTIVDYTRKAIDLRGKRKGSYYDVCLNDYEKGGSEKQLDAFFDALKARVLPLIRKIRDSGKTIRDDFLERPCEIAKQEAFSRYLLEMEGLRKDALVLMTTEHPFTTNFGPHDVRVTTHYYEKRFISNIFSTLHEGGHALFMQREPEEIHANHLADRATSAMHECMSRFFENIVGRSEEFIHAVYPKIQSTCGETFADVSEREFYEAVNIAEPGLLRLEADELTYCVHILIRYEMEKAFINGDIGVEDVPELWKKKYGEYLGVEPQNDAEGALQDVHWTDMYGYFPSYALGSAYGVQLLRRMERDFDVMASVRAGNLLPIADWLTEHAFACASILTPDQWILEVTGEPFRVDYYLDYLEKKFTAIYDL